MPDPAIASLFTPDRTICSVEFYPPKDDAGVQALRETAATLQELQPDFVSVTYGAGGSTRARTAEVVRLLREEFGYLVMPHLTCIGSSARELTDLVADYHAAGIRNLMVLRGDLPKSGAAFHPSPDAPRFAVDLVRLIRRHFPDICLGVAGYPETHPEAPDAATDLAHLKAKVEAGGAFVTTQLFFNNAHYTAFVDRCRQAGIAVPILPGIMPVLSLKQIRRFTAMCGASLPEALVRRLEAAEREDRSLPAEGVEWAAGQLQSLLQGNAPGVHLYVLNRAAAALELGSRLAPLLGR
ncbi:MAG: methylenetetrahydrofolate reductase [NAD(P)H] [Puniceicoccaceae bacterium]|nr:MAG: methylenetetrahydrofolate reductase [NAD(P)H] [Puniceicoccaceae bacterium]